MLSKKSKIFIAGHKGMVGSSIQRKLKKLGYKNLLVAEKKKINLLDQKKVFSYLRKNKPRLVIIAAARVGGILANSKNKDSFLYENLQIQNNLIHGAYLAKIKNLIFLGSSCIYPKNCKQPMKEKYILTGKLEETNDAYAIAKIAGIYMCASYSKNYNLNYFRLRRLRRICRGPAGKRADILAPRPQPAADAPAWRHPGSFATACRQAAAASDAVRPCAVWRILPATRTGR